MNDLHASSDVEEGEIPSLNESAKPRNKIQRPSKLFKDNSEASLSEEEVEYVSLGKRPFSFRHQKQHLEPKQGNPVKKRKRSPEKFHKDHKEPFAKTHFLDVGGRVICKKAVLGLPHERNCSKSHDTRNYPCKYYHATGFCENNISCPFSHSRIVNKQAGFEFIRDNEDFFLETYRHRGETALGGIFLEFLDNKKGMGKKMRENVSFVPGNIVAQKLAAANSQAIPIRPPVPIIQAPVPRIPAKLPPIKPIQAPNLGFRPIEIPTLEKLKPFEIPNQELIKPRPLTILTPIPHPQDIPIQPPKLLQNLMKFQKEAFDKVFGAQNPALSQPLSNPESESHSISSKSSLKDLKEEISEVKEQPNEKEGIVNLLMNIAKKSNNSLDSIDISGESLTQETRQKLISTLDKLKAHKASQSQEKAEKSKEELLNEKLRALGILKGESSNGSQMKDLVNKFFKSKDPRLQTENSG